MPIQTSRHTIKMLTASLLAALLIGISHAQPINSMIPGKPEARTSVKSGSKNFSTKQAGRSKYDFGHGLDTVVSQGDIMGLASLAYPGATLFYPTFQKIGKGYGLLTVFIKLRPVPEDSVPADHTAVYGPQKAIGFVRQYQKGFTEPSPLRGFGSAFFSPFTKAMGNRFAIFSIYVKLEEGERGDGRLGHPLPGGPFLQLHGNIAYTFDYRSRLDTPFAATNLQQHNEQVYADAIFAGKYPFRVILNSRQSNSVFFSDYTDVSLQFDRQAFRRKIQEEMMARLSQKLNANENPGLLDALAKKQRQKWAALKSWVESPARRQEVVQEREALLQQVSALEKKRQQLVGEFSNAGEKQRLDSLQKSLLQAASKKVEQKIEKEKNDLAKTGGGDPKDGTALCKREEQEARLLGLTDTLGLLSKKIRGIDSLLKSRRPDRAALAGILVKKFEKQEDSLKSRLALSTETEKEVSAKKKALDSLYGKFKAIEQSSDSLKKDVQSRIAGYGNSLAGARSPSELDGIAKKAGSQGLSGTDKKLLAVTQLAVGRTNIAYSDLTANNISLSGINIEYNPSYYAAIAVGSVDYQFRDFVTGGGLPKQNLLLGRIGWGDKDRQTVILTAYTGTKNNFGGSTDSSRYFAGPNSLHLFGYSLETRYRIDRNADFSFEAAKSSTPYTQNADRSKSMDHAFAFSDHSNEAWSAKFNMAVPAIQSQFNAFYKQVGENFQSYSLFSSGTRQESWGIKWHQYLWAKKLALTAQVRKNGFDNPLVANSYNSLIIFKSIQAVLRIRKWPVLSMGYMPSSQLTKSPDGSFKENVYYTFTSSAVYSFKALHEQMASSLLYTRFYNKGTDTGFVRYNARDVLFTHNIEFGKWRTQSGLQYTEQPQLRYWMFQQQVDVTIGKKFALGAGGKTYRLTDGTHYWGGTARATVQLDQKGGLRLQYDKGYLPDGYGALVPDDWGRLSWYKIF